MAVLWGGGEGLDDGGLAVCSLSLPRLPRAGAVSSDARDPSKTTAGDGKEWGGWCRGRC